MGKEFCERGVVASPCLGIKSQMFSCKVFWDLLPLSSQPRCLNVPSVPLHVLFHPPGLLFLPYSSNLTNSYRVFTSSERAPETACSGQTPRCPVFNCITSHYLFSQMFGSLGAETGHALPWDNICCSCLAQCLAHMSWSVVLLERTKG